MIHVYKIPFGTSELKIKTEIDLKEKVIKDIIFFIKTFSTELNHNILNSSAYKFNETQVGIPAIVRPEFLDFLSLCIKIYSENIIEDELFFGIEREAITQSMTIDFSSNFVSKNQDLAFNTAPLRTIYILDTLSDYLKNEVKLKDYLINYDGYFIAVGGKEWKVELQRKDKFIGIRNEAIIMEDFDNTESERGERFASINTPLKTSTIIIEGQNLLQNKVNLKNIPKLRYEYEFKRFAQDSGYRFILVDREDEIYGF